MKTDRHIADFGYLRAAVVSPEHRVGDVAFNTDQTIAALHELAPSGVQLAVFPELGLTSHSLGDLFHQGRWIGECAEAVGRVAEVCAKTRVVAIVGLPVAVDGRLYNAALVVGSDGRPAGVVPKTYLPSTGEFYEGRWFARGDDTDAKFVRLGAHDLPFGVDLLFETGGGLVGVEICEDLWAVRPPSLDQALAGASLLVNLSASNELLGKACYRRDLVTQQSARCLAAYLYASAGPGESSTDLLFSGHSIIAENGVVLAETGRFSLSTRSAVADLDLPRMEFERRRNSSFAQGRPSRAFRRIPLPIAEWPAGTRLLRPVPRHPFVPEDPASRAENCREIFAIQSTALARRLRHTGAQTIVLGLSGGLDSTLAALVACQSFDSLGLPRTGILAVGMPGFGTTPRTRGNAARLAEHLGLDFREIPITESVGLHFRDIGHPESLHDTTFENAQARERTQILMDLANKSAGFVLGTGDLSELALGWCTFNGDHMSMYHINAGVPKTLVRFLVAWCADEVFTGPAAEILRDICETPITPELLPVSKRGELVQKTEETIGPYELHDFFLYHFVRGGHPPEKILFLAETAFDGAFGSEEITHWLNVFLKRFFQQQFKRNAMPDAPKIGSVGLSPRGDWRMPSDATPPPETTRS